MILNNRCIDLDSRNLDCRDLCSSGLYCENLERRDLGMSDFSKVSKVILQFLFSFIFLGFSGVSYAQDSKGPVANIKTTKEKIQSLVNDYYSKKALQSFTQIFNGKNSSTLSIQNFDDRCPPHRPPDNNKSCVDAICSRISQYECDDISDMRNVNQICSNQYDGGCIDSICNHVSRYECDDLSDMSKIGKICEGQYNGRCTDAVCAHISKYECDDLSDLENISNSCRGFYDTGCIDSVCSRLSRYECDDLSDMKQVIQLCRGQ